MALRGTADTNGMLRSTNYPTDTSWTMMGWFYATSFTVRGFLVGRMAGAGASKRLRIETSGALSLYGGADAIQGSTILLDTWFHATLTYDGATAFAYLNGLLDLSRANATTAQGDLYVGNDDPANGANQYLNGRWAAIKVWSAVLTEPEIRLEMKQYVPFRNGQLNTFSPCRTIPEAPINFAGITPWTLGGTHGEEAGPPIPYVIRLPRRRVFFLVTPPVQYDVTLDSTTTPAGSLVKQVNKNASGVLAPIGALVKRVSVTASGVVTPVGTLVYQIGKVIGGVITPAGEVVVGAAFSFIIAAALGVSGALTKQVGKVVEATITPAGRIAEQVNKVLAGAMAITGNVVKQGNKVVSGALSLVGTLTSVAAAISTTVVSGAIAIAGSISSTFIEGSGVVLQGLTHLWRRRRR